MKSYLGRRQTLPHLLRKSSLLWNLGFVQLFPMGLHLKAHGACVLVQGRPH